MVNQLKLNDELCNFITFKKYFSTLAGNTLHKTCNLQLVTN